jgi:Rps23 Pro-64 3,4-dihydroxylase Tpa1-like proline 4-hydroxylase
MSLATLSLAEAASNCVIIRGRRIDLDRLFASDIKSPTLTAARRSLFCNNTPFDHIVIDGLFNEQLLRSVEEEFPPAGAKGWNNVIGRHESTYRSHDPTELGPAAQIYFNLVKSNPFVGYLSAITGIPDLITDHTLLGGGLHEARAGGRFAVHRDFNFHHKTMLANTLVFLTYLNKDWISQYGGALELWDEMRNQKIKEIEPLFGRSILFRHSDRSFHGPPAPLTPLTGRSRRSLCSYYYVNNLANHRRLMWEPSRFLDDQNIRKRPVWSQFRHRVSEVRSLDTSGRLKYFARGLTPPILWSAAKSVRKVFEKPD